MKLLDERVKYKEVPGRHRLQEDMERKFHLEPVVLLQCHLRHGCKHIYVYIYIHTCARVCVCIL